MLLPNRRFSDLCLVMRVPNGSSSAPEHVWMEVTASAGQVFYVESLLTIGINLEAQNVGEIQSMWLFKRPIP